MQTEELAANSTDPFAQALWSEHRKRMATRIANLQSGLPETRIAERDPWALRGVAALLLVIAFAFSGGPLGGRISDAFLSHAASNAIPPRIDAWVTPPRYTGHAPLLLTTASNSADTQFSVPQNSTLVVRIIGGSGSEALTQKLSDGKSVEIAARETPKIEDSATGKATPRNFELTLDQNSSIDLVNGRSALSSWGFTIIPDQPPAIRFTKEPSSAVNGTMDVFYEIKDDYGAIAAQAKIEQALPAEKDARPLYSAPELPLALPRRGEQAKETKTTEGSHPAPMVWV